MTRKFAKSLFPLLISRFVYTPRLVTLCYAISALALYGCDSSNSPYSTAYPKCAELDGVAMQHVNDNGDTVDACYYEETTTYDDGEQIHEHICELSHLSENACADGGGDDAAGSARIASRAVQPTCPTCPKTVREVIRDQVDDILSKLDNTGYSHRPFSLDPDYPALITQTAGDPIETYDLFTDCSGFVGYYTLQGIVNPLYEQLPRTYSCGPLEEDPTVTTPPARPLAADFVDHFKEAISFNGIEPTDVESACWSSVEHISDALPGDIIAYLHEENLDLDKGYCCKRVENAYTDDDIVTTENPCTGTDERIIYKAVIGGNGKRKNTGHVLFIHDVPYRSVEKRDDNHTYQWVVEIADSTTSPHMADGRAIGKGISYFGSNYYHAWTKGDEGYVQKCTNGEYHRDCVVHGSIQEGGNIDINTTLDHATGIGIGKMYVNHNMDGYRTSYSHKIVDATVVIGRPIACSTIP